MTESVDRQTAVLRLRGADDILILCHKNPDGDTIGCAGALYLALKALGKNAAILCSDTIPKMYDYMELRWFDGSFNPAFVVAVDVASIQLFGENNNVPQYAAHTNLCIDHHASNSGYAYETLLDPGAAAACEFLLDVIVDMGVLLGRKPSAEVPAGAKSVKLEDPTRTISRNHAAISFDQDGTLWIEDYGSLNGTYIIQDDVETKVEHKPMQLEAPCTVRIGDQFFQFRKQ